MFTRLYGLETVTIRYFNVFGPRQDPSSPYSGVISLFISALCDGRRPTIYGDGEQTRDFTYVGNVVDGVLRACHAPAASGEVINVATAHRISLKQLFEIGEARSREHAGARFTPTRVQVTFATRWPTSTRPSACSATRRSSVSMKGSDGRWRGIASRWWPAGRPEPHPPEM